MPISRAGERLSLILMVCFALSIRTLLITAGGLTPGDDSAAAAGFIYTILSQARIPSSNLYHMPGTPYTYPPVFHLLGCYIVLSTGLSELAAAVALGVIADTLMILPITCLTKKLCKNNTTALLSGFLFTVSNPDFNMLFWGGYVNIMALLFIVTISSFALNRKKFDLKEASLLGVLAGALLLTHHFSAFTCVLLVTALITITAAGYVSKRFTVKNGIDLSKRLMLASVLGLIISSGWFTAKTQFYLQMLTPSETMKEATMTANVANLSLFALTGMSATMFAVMCLTPLGALLISRKWGWSDSKCIAMFVWIIVPMMFAYSFVFGFAVNTQRFLYFAVHPAMILSAMALSYLLSRSVTLGRAKRSLALTLLGTLVLVYSLGSVGSANLMHDFYLTTRETGTNAISWIRHRTPEGAVIVANHSLAWWISGTAHRPTLSATPAYFIAYPYEEPLTQAACNIVKASEGYLEVVDQHGVRYIVCEPLKSIDQHGAWHFVYKTDYRLKFQNERRLDLVFNNGRICIFRVND